MYLIVSVPEFTYLLSIGKKLLPLGEYSFLIVDCFSKEDWCAEQQTGSHKHCLLCEEWWLSLYRNMYKKTCIKLYLKVITTNDQSHKSVLYFQNCVL